MNPPEHPANRTATLLKRFSVILDPLPGLSPTLLAQSASPDPTAMSQDSPARIDSSATSFFGSSGTSLVTVPPAPPQEQAPLQLHRLSGFRTIWPPQQVPRVLQGHSLAHAGTLTHTEVLSRGSYAGDEEEELLDGPASLLTDVAELVASPAPREIEELAAQEELNGLNTKSITIDQLSDCSYTSFAQRSFLLEGVVEVTMPISATTTEGLCADTGLLLTSCEAPLSLQAAAPHSMTLERSATPSDFQGVATLEVTGMRLPLSLTRGEPSISSPPTLQRTLANTSRQSTADAMSVTSPLHPRLPLQAQPPQKLCGSPPSWDVMATSTQSSRAALGPKQVAPLMTFAVFDPTISTPTSSTSLQSSWQVGGVPQALYHKSADKNLSTQGAVHVDNASSRRLSPNVSDPRTGATYVGESSAVQSLLRASKLGSSGFLPPLASPSASVGLLSAQEEVPPSPSPLRASLTRRSSRFNVSSSPRSAFITSANSTTVSTSALPYSPILLSPMQPSATTPAAQYFPPGAPRALRGRQHGVRSPLEAIWLRNEGMSALSESTLSTEGCNKVNSLILNTASPTPAVAARNAGVLLGSLSQEHLQPNGFDLSPSLPSHEISAARGVEVVVPGNAMPQTGRQPVGERERRSMIQRIFRESPKGGQRVWVSIATPESHSSSGDISEKS
ncbi:hypothetical protein Q4I32_006199 [Leishmania shawi]|uniref:Proteophosphoglycan ppg4 n=1 Tax=Leishmania shawi TaxID=5680 RepID=A0AAW3BDD9_9TRYP